MYDNMLEGQSTEFVQYSVFLFEFEVCRLFKFFQSKQAVSVLIRIIKAEPAFKDSDPPEIIYDDRNQSSPGKRCYMPRSHNVHLPFDVWLPLLHFP